MSKEIKTSGLGVLGVLARVIPRFHALGPLENLRKPRKIFKHSSAQII